MKNRNNICDCNLNGCPLCSDISNNGRGTRFSDYLSQGMSNRHVEAHNDCEKLMMGEAGKILSKKFGMKISAADAKGIINPTEWHHAGAYKPASGGRLSGRRVYWTTYEAVEAIALADVESYYGKVEAKAAADKLAACTLITGFYFEWAHDYSGRYGKKVNHKVLRFYNGSELGKPAKNFTPCGFGWHDLYQDQSGRKYYGWDEPTATDIEREAIRRNESATRAIVAAKADAERKIIDDAARAEKQAAFDVEYGNFCAQIEAHMEELAALHEVKELHSRNSKPGYAIWNERPIADKVFAIVPYNDIIDAKQVLKLVYRNVFEKSGVSL